MHPIHVIREYHTIISIITALFSVYFLVQFHWNGRQVYTIFEQLYRSKLAVTIFNVQLMLLQSSGYEFLLLVLFGQDLNSQEEVELDIARAECFLGVGTLFAMFGGQLNRMDYARVLALFYSAVAHRMLKTRLTRVFQLEAESVDSEVPVQGREDFASNPPEPSPANDGAWPCFLWIVDNCLLAKSYHLRVAIIHAVLMAVDVACTRHYARQWTFSSGSLQNMFHLMLLCVHSLQLLNILQSSIQYSLDLINVTPPYRHSGPWFSYYYYTSMLKMAGKMSESMVLLATLVPLVYHHYRPMNLFKLTLRRMGQAMDEVDDFISASQVWDTIDSLPQPSLDEVSKKRTSGGSEPISDVDWQQCSICLEDLVNRTVKDAPSTEGVRKLVHCSHMFHLACLRSWTSQRQTCPTCRTPLLETPTPFSQIVQPSSS